MREVLFGLAGKTKMERVGYVQKIETHENIEVVSFILVRVAVSMWSACRVVKALYQDQGVSGSIPAALVMCKSLGQAYNLHCPCPPSSNGQPVE